MNTRGDTSEQGERMNPIPIGTLVDYRGSEIYSHGRYVITGHQDPLNVLSSKELDLITDTCTLADVYPDGVAYVIWKYGVLQKFGNRMHSVSRVRRGSLSIAENPA